VASFLNIALEYKAFNGLLGGLSSDSTEKLSFFEQQKRDLKAMFAKSVDANVDRSDEQTPFIVWFGGTVLLMIATFFIYSFYFSHFGVLVWHTIVTMLITVLLALVYLQILVYIACFLICRVKPIGV
jgi:hypothetical protein